MKITDEMVDRFLAWPLPDSVCSDTCVTVKDYGVAQGWPKRSGTSLLTANEARQMLDHVLSTAPSAIAPLRGKDAALLPGLREALKWKPHTPQLENAMTYAWESALKSFISAIEKSAPTDEGAKG